MSAVRNLNRPALLASLVVTLTLVLLERTSVLDGLEGAALTLRFQYGRSAPHPLSEPIALVAIDDSSEANVGRWPWARSVQAMAIDELARAGARAVAFDVLYNEPSGEPAEDLALAKAIGRCKGIVGADVDPSGALSEIWMDVAGTDALRRLLDTLGHSVSLPENEVVSRAGLESPYRERFLEQPLGFRKLAAWTRLQELRENEQRPETLEGFQEALGLSTAFGTGSWPGARLIDRVWERDSAWQVLSRFMPPKSGPASPKELPPILPIAMEAGGVGMVQGSADASGEMRRVRPFVPTPAGDCLQLGIAGAAHYLGVDPQDVRVTSESVFVGDHAIPVDHGRVMIDWPTATFDGFPRLRGGGPKRVAIPISTLWSLSDQREVQVRQEAAYAEQAAAVEAYMSRPKGQLTTLPIPADIRNDVRDSIEFGFPSLLDKGIEALPQGLSDGEMHKAKVIRIWALLEDAVLKGRDEIRRSEAEMQRLLGGKLVFVGFIATGALADMINTPYGPRTPGVFVHAVVASMVLERQGLTMMPAWFGPVATAALAVVCGLIAAGASAGRGSIGAMLILALASAGAWLAFGWWSIVVPMAGPLIGGFGSWVAGVTLVAVISQRERARITRQFRARVSPQLVERLAADPNALSVGGIERQVTILFGDLAGFTTLSEKLGGAEVVSTLNRYMGTLTRELTARRAYVNKFLGDGLLAFWSAFGEEPEQHRLSAEAAQACQDAVQKLGEDPQFKDRPPIRLRLGIATGKVVVGDCGAPPELNDYTVIGDAVNLASRLESANKQFGTRILMDGTTAEGVRASPGMTRLLALGRVIVVGQSVPVELFTVLDQDQPDGWTDAIEKGVAAFRSGDRAAALAVWREIDRRFGHPSIAKQFLASLEDASETCDGILRLRAK